MEFLRKNTKKKKKLMIYQSFKINVNSLDTKITNQTKVKQGWQHPKLVKNNKVNKQIEKEEGKYGINHENYDKL